MTNKTKEPYDPLKLAFIFKDVSCTVPANHKLAIWLQWMLDNEKDSLHWLFRESQAYIKHGGGSTYTQANWLKRLTNNVGKVLEEKKRG